MAKGLTWEVLEDNGGGLHLAVREDGRVIYYATGYEHDVGSLRYALEELQNNAHPIRDAWEIPSWIEEGGHDIQALYDNLVSTDYGSQVVADKTGLFIDRMGAAARFEFAVKEVAVIEVGDDTVFPLETFETSLPGTDADVIEKAIALVENRGYKVVRYHEGGCCEVTHYSDGTAKVGITVAR